MTLMDYIIEEFIVLRYFNIKSKIVLKEKSGSLGISVKRSAFGVCGGAEHPHTPQMRGPVKAIPIEPGLQIVEKFHQIQIKNIL
jgi:hypothetical protein